MLLFLLSLLTILFPLEILGKKQEKIIIDRKSTIQFVTIKDKKSSTENRTLLPLVSIPSQNEKIKEKAEKRRGEETTRKKGRKEGRKQKE